MLYYVILYYVYTYVYIYIYIYIHIHNIDTGLRDSQLAAMCRPRPKPR